MADGFTACGGRVFISDVDAAALAASGHDGMIADAGEAAAMEAFVDGAVTRLGGLDVLVNNAGIAGPTAPVERVTPAELEETLRVDLAAMFHCSRRAVQALRAAGGRLDREPQLGRRTLRFCAPQPLRRREMGRRRFYQDACHRARPRLHQRQRDPTRTGRRSADQTSPEGKGGSERDRGE
jgi:NAD(P)-dependent dehydrogenase (short-subunit alcohol dehydrogenase family)